MERAAEEEGEKNYLLFYSGTSRDGARLTHSGEGRLLSRVHGLERSSHPETSSWTHPGTTFNLDAPWPVMLT